MSETERDDKLFEALYSVEKQFGAIPMFEVAIANFITSVEIWKEKAEDADRAIAIERERSERFRT